MKTNEQVKKELEQEYNELHKKYLKLDDFTRTDEFKSLPQIQQDLLYLQESTMSSYYDILHMRIKNLS